MCQPWVPQAVFPPVGVLPMIPALVTPRAAMDRTKGVTMPYMLPIIEPPGQRRTRSEAEGRAVYERMLRFGEQLQARGLLR